MIIGVGADIFDVSRISPYAIRTEDPFFTQTFTAAEQKQASERAIPLYYYATRFAGKEAVYKAISICGLEFDAGEIEILDDNDGRPHVRIFGRTAQELERLVPKYRVFVSLSFEKDFANAFAIAEAGDEEIDQ